MKILDSTGLLPRSDQGWHYTAIEYNRRIKEKRKGSLSALHRQQALFGCLIEIIV